MLNVVALVGRMVANPELRHTASSVPMVRFAIAVTRSYVRQGEDRQTDFFDVTAWRSTAEFVCNHFGKGHLIAVEGSIQIGSYQDPNGIKRKTVTIIASNVHFVEAKNSNPGSSEDKMEKVENIDSSAYSSGTDQDFITDDDLPF